MTYCLEADIAKAIPGGTATLTKLADLDGDGAADTGVVDDAIAYADGLINSYCGTKYTVPVSDVNALTVLKRHAVHLAVYELRRGKGQQAEREKENHDRAIAFLRDISAGRASLGITTSPPAQDADGGVTATHDANSDFQDSLDTF